MITPAEAQEHAGRWGVAPAQVEKDHLISHVLDAIAATGFECHFYGGTALNRTYLSGRRLSEDIDLMVADPNVDVAAALRRHLLAEVGDARWIESSRLLWMRTFRIEALGAAIKLQLARFDPDDRRWGWLERQVDMRYGCLAKSVQLLVPEVAGFVAMKLSAFTDRWAPRDLFDLAGLAEIGAITPVALERYRFATARAAVLHDFTKVRNPTAIQWTVELSHQTGMLATPQEASQMVWRAIDRAQAQDQQ